MKLVDEIDEMAIEQVRADFYALMSEIVTEHGDDQEEEKIEGEGTDAE